MSRRSVSRDRKLLDPATSQDLAGSATREPRITPRNSQGEDVSSAIVETPWRTLNQLASIPRPTTPLRRASSAGPSSTRRRTPATQARTPGGPKAGGSARRPVAVTPHGRAAQRELESRRAGLTPGRERRRSGIQQRDTPRDTLRALSRLLAPKTAPIVPTPQGPSNAKPRLMLSGDDDLDDGIEFQRPRLSLPLGDEDDDEDDSSFLPPRSAGLEDENFTGHSIEMARRAISEQPLGRLSRGSFGSIRMSDIFADLNNFGPNGDPDMSSYLADGDFGDSVIPDLADEVDPPAENTETLHGVGRIATATGRYSDIRPAELGADDTETTFVFSVPQRDVSEQLSPALSTGAPSQGRVDEASDADDADDAANNDVMDFRGEEDASSREASPEAAANETSMLDIPQDVSIIMENKKMTKKKKVKISKHGTPYPSLPSGVVKKLATTFARTAGNSKAKLNKETLEVIMQATDWFFEQVGDDLGAYAKHAGRKTIDESDITTLMARQRQTNATTTPFSLAQKHLPRELLQELRMVPPPKMKKGKPLDTVEEVAED